jgi:hypothetical protein
MILVQFIKAYRGNILTASLILNLRTNWKSIEDSNAISLQELEFGAVNGIKLTQDMDQWLALEDDDE